MNVFLFEIKAQFRSIVIWTITLVLALILFMQGMFPVFEESVNDIKELFAAYPKEYLQFLGFDFQTFFTYSGFYSFIYSYIGVVGVIMAVIMALSVFAREKRSKCMDFLMSKPISHSKIFWMKTLACIILLTGSNIIYTLSSACVYLLNDQKREELDQFIIATLGLYFTQLVFFAIGVLAAHFFKKIRSVSGIATSFGFSAFILSAFANLIDKEILYFFAPLKYFEPNTMMVKGHFEWKYSIMAVIIIFICIGISFIQYNKSDIHAV